MAERTAPCLTPLLIWNWREFFPFHRKFAYCRIYIFINNLVNIKENVRLVSFLNTRSYHVKILGYAVPCQKPLSYHIHCACKDIWPIPSKITDTLNPSTRCSRTIFRITSSRPRVSTNRRIIIKSNIWSIKLLSAIDL